MNNSVNQGEADMQQSMLDGSVNDEFQALEAAQSSKSPSETDWSVLDEEPPKPDSTNTDQDAIEETPREDTQQREEEPPEPALTSRRRLVLEDYEIQLRLLEAQNKRRLEMARQEQAKLVPSLHMQPAMKAPPAPSPSAAMNTMQGNPTMAIQNRMGIMSLHPANQSQIVSMLQAQINALREENQLLRQQLLDAKGANFAIFHCITGEEGDKVYLDRPRWVRRGERFELEASSPVLYPEAYGLYKSLHFVVYKTYSAKVRAETKRPLRPHVGSEMPAPEPDSEIIKFVSEEMVAAMEKLVERDEAMQQKLPGLVSDRELRAPHLWWYCYRNRGDMLDDLTPSQADAMQSLMRWLDEVYSKAHSQADDQFKRGMVSASSMGYLIQPGDVLVCRVEHGFEARLATSWLREVAIRPDPQMPDEVPLFADQKSSMRRWEVDTWSYRYNGDFYRMKSRPAIQLADPTHDAEISIADLDAFPLRFASEEVRDTLERRGKIFWDCRNGKYVSYCTKAKSYTPQQRYMIDHRTFQMRYSEIPLFGDLTDDEELKRFSRVNPAFIDQVDAPSAPDLYLFPRTIPGYDLLQQRWKELEVDHIREITWNKNASGHLSAELETPELAKAIITGHVSSQAEAGWVQSKNNKGPILLLRGDTGTGKTYAVQSAAELVEKPLSVVRCSELGTRPDDVEERLQEIFCLAETWGCILLLTEAEVFLQQRTCKDAAQDARVSAFIRALEGYEGVLILESNRLIAMDDAFRSHIDVPLLFWRLGEPQRAHVWRNLFDSLKSLGEDEMDFDDLNDYIDELAKYTINGHQMQNVLTRARQLARFQKRKMTAGHLQSVVNLIQFGEL